MRTRIFIAALLVLALAPLARADGLPVSDAGGPATIAGNSGRYMAVPTAKGTLVVHYSDVVYASHLLDGRFAVPVVALDGSATGMSFDGSTLVLINPRRSFPRSQTTFAVLDARNMSLRSTIVLDGDYSFDALSPDGTRMYLIHYESPRDPTRYEVRAYDIAAHRLLPNPIVDKAEPDERMAGLPITRVMSADGRFAYTLYDGGGKTPFVHALDTVSSDAHCIDLDALAGNQDLYNLRFSLAADGTRLAVVAGSRQIVAFDTRTYVPVAKVAAPTESSRNRVVVALTILVLLAAVVGLYALRRVLRARSVRGARPGPERRSSHRVA
jgi:uncharacterized membrane protein